MESEKPFLSPTPLPPERPVADTDDAAAAYLVPPGVLRSYSQRRSGSSQSQTSDKITASDAFLFAGEVKPGSRSTVPLATLSRSGSRPGGGRYPSKRNDSERLTSQREIPDEEARFVYINDPGRTNSPPVQFPSNAISTTKYNVLTFLPRNLFEQFHRVAYIYFLVLIILNQIPQLGVFSPAASVMPLAFVLGVTAVKDAYEDWRRHRSDRNENARTALAVADGEFRPKLWKDIRVGDVVKVAADETIPCDVVLLATSDPTGVAYVQTINLDGESNLKTRYAKQEILAAPAPPESAHGLIRCERPNRNIYGFQANVDVDGDGGKKVSLGPSNIILRGCQLKNTSWVVGVVVFTGKDTKVMLNSSGPPSKRSKIEGRMNREIIVLAGVLATLCSTVTILAGLWLHNHYDELDTLPYYRKWQFSGGHLQNYKYYGMGWEIIFTFMMSVILFQVMVPISLYISMELVRLGQAYFMIQDLHMYDEATDTRFQCRALNINEDLGQIKYVFSDKTGTLTENKMEFRRASVYGMDFSEEEEGEGEGHSITVDDQTWRPKMKVKTDPKLVELVMRGEKGTVEVDRAHDFLLALATCNTIVPIVLDTSEPSLKLVEYQGESPDEQALVYAAAAYGYVLVERSSGHIAIDVRGERQRFQLRMT